MSDDLEKLAAKIEKLSAADKLRLAAGLIDADRLTLALRVAEQAVEAMQLKVYYGGPVDDEDLRRVRSLCEAVAAAERERCAEAARAAHPASDEPGCTQCRTTTEAVRRIRSLRGLPEIGRPGK